MSREHNNQPICFEMATGFLNNSASSVSSLPTRESATGTANLMPTLCPILRHAKEKARHFNAHYTTMYMPQAVRTILPLQLYRLHYIRPINQYCSQLTGCQESPVSEPWHCRHEPAFGL